LSNEPDFPAFTFPGNSATIVTMFKLEILFELVVQVLRTLLVDEFSDRARELFQGLRIGGRQRGMKEIRQRINRQCRRRLLRRIST